MAKPDKLRIAYEDYDYGRFNCVGQLPDGTQFMAFVTGAFPTGMKYYLGDDWQHKKKWLAVIHRFDADGNHIGSETKLGAFDIGFYYWGSQELENATAYGARLVRTGQVQAGGGLNTKTALRPPNANELDIVWITRCERPSFGT